MQLKVMMVAMGIKILQTTSGYQIWPWKEICIQGLQDFLRHEVVEHEHSSVQRRMSTKQKCASDKARVPGKSARENMRKLGICSRLYRESKICGNQQQG